MATHYLVTGGYGLIGSNLVNNVKGNVSIITRSDKNSDRVIRNDVKIIKKSILDTTMEDFSNVDVIYHCASTTHNYHVLDDPYIDVETNLKGTIHILELCKQMKKKPKFVFLSTFFVYGNTYDKTNKPITEESPTDPLGIYPATKLCAESIIKLYSRLYAIPYLVARLTNVYGEMEDYTNKKKGGLNYLIMEAIKGHSLNIYKGGNFQRDYIHVNDVVSALQFLESKHNDTFLIGYGTPVTFKTLISYILELTGSKAVVKEIEPPEFHKVVGINDFVANTKKLSALGWRSTISPKKGIKRVVDRYKKIATQKL